MQHKKLMEKDEEVIKTKEDFVDDFKFSAKYHFSVVSPKDEKYSHINLLTRDDISS